MSSPQTPIVTPLPCFLDNYIWHIETSAGDWVVDPGDASVVLAHQSARGKSLAGVLVTHHHLDHTAGIGALAEAFGMPVYGPSEVRGDISHYVSTHDTLTLPGLGSVQVLDVAAHTLGHIAYYLVDHGLLFCGDSLFSAGCGRLFEGTPADLTRVMTRLSALPATTIIFPTHEYTVANLRFAQAVEPANQALKQYALEVADWRAANHPSLPTTLARELSINPFLRSHKASVIAAASDYANKPLAGGEQTLATLRAWKDVF
ncbi:MAG: hydroxyacylglutathione hydrolase [Paraperlucidibaca sp.]